MDGNETYYHGTSDIHRLDIGDYIEPSDTTGKLQEVGRNKNLDKNFFYKRFRFSMDIRRKISKHFSVKKAARELEIKSYSSITRRLNETYKQMKGWRFSYVKKNLV